MHSSFIFFASTYSSLNHVLTSVDAITETGLSQKHLSLFSSPTNQLTVTILYRTDDDDDKGLFHYSPVATSHVHFSSQ